MSISSTGTVHTSILVKWLKDYCTEDICISQLFEEDYHQNEFINTKGKYIGGYHIPDYSNVLIAEVGHWRVVLNDEFSFTSAKFSYRNYFFDIVNNGGQLVIECVRVKASLLKRSKQQDPLYRWKQRSQRDRAIFFYANTYRQRDLKSIFEHPVFTKDAVITFEDDKSKNAFVKLLRHKDLRNFFK